MDQLDKQIKSLYCSCVKKKAYKSLKVAKKAARGSTQTFKIPFYVYMCHNCLQYHLTTKKQNATNYVYSTEQDKLDDNSEM